MSATVLQYCDIYMVCICIYMHAHNEYCETVWLPLHVYQPIQLSCVADILSNVTVDALKKDTLVE